MSRGVLPTLLFICIAAEVCSKIGAVDMELKEHRTGRSLTASVHSLSKSKAESRGNGKARSDTRSTATAYDDASSVSEAIGIAISNGGGEAAAKAVSDAVTRATEDGVPLDAIAIGVARATSIERGAAKGLLENGDTRALAEAIVESGGGFAYAEASSIAEAVARKRDVVIRAVHRIYSHAELDGPVSLVIKREVKAIGEAVAEVFTNAIVTLEVEGVGKAQGIARADSYAISRAFAKVLLEGIAVSSSKFGVAIAEFDAESIASAIAEAAATALAETHLYDTGYAESSQTNLASGVSIPIAHVLLHAVTYAYGTTTRASLKLEADSYVDHNAAVSTEGSSTVYGIGSAESTGTAFAYAKIAKPCRRRASRCCFSRNVYNDKCLCKDREQGCQLKSFFKENGRTTHWLDTDTKDICYCDW